MAYLLRILHLEDSQDDAYLIKRTLKDNGIAAEILVAKDAREFANALGAGGFDLILADNSVAGLDSREALQSAQARLPGTPFICLSGAARENRVAELLSAGATDFVLKDDTEHLLSAVRRVADAKARGHGGV